MGARRGTGSEQRTMGWGGGGSCTPRPPIRQQPAPERRVVTVVFLSLLLDLLAFTLLLPLLPGLLESHGRANDPLYGSWQRGVDWFATAIGMPVEKRYNSVLFGGLIGSVFSILQFLSAPITGAVSDSLGRRPVMLLSLTGLAASYAVWATSRSFAAFLASRVIGGISKGNVSLSTAIIADLGSPPARSQGMAVIGVAFSLGFTLGPMLGASVSVEAAPWFALLFAVADLLFIFCFLPETLPPEKRGAEVLPAHRLPGQKPSPPPGRPLQLVPAGTFRRPGIPRCRRSAQPCGPTAFLSCRPWPGPPHWRQAQPPAPTGPGLFPLPLPVLGPGVLAELPCTPALPVQQVGPRLGMPCCLPILTPHPRKPLGHSCPGPASGLPHPAVGASVSPLRWGTDTPAPSLQQGKMFFFIGLTMATIQGIYTRRISPGREVAAVKRAILLLVPAFLLIGWGHTLPVLGLGLLLYSFAAAVVVPCLSSVVAGYGSPAQKGTVMGTLRSLGALARAVGPVVAASAYWLAGAQVCFSVCSGLFLLPFLLLWKLGCPAQMLKAE
ncbi:major facilitator superfamily domain-containing protein 10 isoform X1 [Eulemur rufifrons]|uniref:major facilitator superfamily domain-containing protein 10 isoform X1 n=1 Tax=Eulemur rufifrons TaxID=859984 RepID=UPI003741EB2E